MPQHNYLKKIQQLIAAGQLPVRVGLGHLHIFHDNSCGIFTGGYCNCDPEIVYSLSAKTPTLPARKTDA